MADEASVLLRRLNLEARETAGRGPPAMSSGRPSLRFPAHVYSGYITGNRIVAPRACIRL